MSLLNILNAIPAAASRFGGSVIQQAPKAAARVPQAARGVGFDPLNQVPAFFSRFGGSAIQAPSVRNVQSLRGVVPAVGTGMAGLSGAALDPLLRGSQYAQQQLQGFGIIPRPGQIKAKPTEGYSSYGTYTVGGIEYDINSGRPTYMPPGSVYPSSSVAPLSPAAERDYQSQKSAVAQQVAQDPALSKYDRDRAAAIASGDQAKMDAVRDQGMAIWQQKYGGTPMGRTGGAVGMDNPLMKRTFGYQTGSAPDQQMGSPTLGPSPLVPQVDPTLNPAGPNYLGGEGPPLMNFADPRFENMSPEDFQKLLNQVNKK